MVTCIFIDLPRSVYIVMAEILKPKNGLITSMQAQGWIAILLVQYYKLKESLIFSVQHAIYDDNYDWWGLGRLRLSRLWFPKIYCLRIEHCTEYSHPLCLSTDASTE